MYAYYVKVGFSIIVLHYRSYLICVVFCRTTLHYTLPGKVHVSYGEKPQRTFPCKYSTVSPLKVINPTCTKMCTIPITYIIYS